MRPLLHRTLLPLTVALGCFVAAVPAWAQDGRHDPLPTAARPGTFLVEHESGGLKRIAVVHVPKGYQPEKPPPLVLLLHGAGGNGDDALRRYGWVKKADEEGFIVVAPTGLPARPRLASSPRTNPNVWNSGQLNPRGPRAAIDDVAYTRQLLDDLKERTPYDPNRVFVAGHSNGGAMAYMLAANISERFQAVATVAGLISVDDPKPTRPLPTLYIVGTSDPLMPLEGGEVALPWSTRTNPPLRQPLEKWAAAIGCRTEPQTESDTDEIERVVYPSKGDGPTLTVLYLKGHGHLWPGAKVHPLARAAGPNVTKLNATDEIWNFFQKHMP